ncbi:hypothetical protein QBC45DRAFT_322461, partial [Copromyces sp. CBS 386.78]
HKQAGDAPHGPSSVNGVPDPYQKRAVVRLRLFGENLNADIWPALDVKKEVQVRHFQVYTRALVGRHKRPDRIASYYEVFVRRLPHRRDSGAS